MLVHQGVFGAPKPLQLISEKYSQGVADEGDEE
jgi:hypothetical protein